MSSFRYSVHCALDADDDGTASIERFIDALLIGLVLLNTAEQHVDFCSNGGHNL